MDVLFAAALAKPKGPFRCILFTYTHMCLLCVCLDRRALVGQTLAMVKYTSKVYIYIRSHLRIIVYSIVGVEWDSLRNED